MSRAPTLTRIALCIIAMLSPPVGSASGSGADTKTSHKGLELPASFRGMLPCPNCESIQAQLDLWPDGVFHLRRAFVGKPGSDDEIGRWREDPLQPEILLYGGHEMPLRFEIVGPRTLRALDPDGRRLAAGAGDTLVSDGTLSPADINLGLHGMFSYMADAARFEECLTGRAYPVAMVGEYAALERAYAKTLKSVPGAPLMASFEGSIARRPPADGPGEVSTIVVRRFIGVWPGQRCERAMSHASLTDQYWRIASLQGRVVQPAASEREPHLVLESREGRYHASAGCDRLHGSYRVEGERIAFAAPEATAAICAAGAEARQLALTAALVGARRWSVHAPVLELFDASGRTVAVFEAVDFR
jgi:heat shock protein HslJ